MLNPCDPCVCYEQSCSKCTFGCKTEKQKHEHMKRLINDVNAGKQPLGYMLAMMYMYFHENWQSELELEEKYQITKNKDCRFRVCLKDGSMLYFKGNCNCIDYSDDMYVFKNVTDNVQITLAIIPRENINYIVNAAHNEINK